MKQSITDFELKTIVKIDSSNYVFAEVLSQRDKDEIIKFVTFFFKSLLSAECNYEIYDKKLLAIIKCFEQEEMTFELNKINTNDSKIFVSEKKRMKLIQKIHDQSDVRHSSVKRTHEMTRKIFFWLKMKAIIEQFIRNCHICKRIKAFKDEYSDLLNPISISNRSWTDIFIDFVIDFFEFKDNNAIVMIVNRFSKMHHYISCSVSDEEITTAKIACMLIRLSVESGSPDGNPDPTGLGSG
jgi:hypothetical protein